MTKSNGFSRKVLDTLFLCSVSALYVVPSRHRAVGYMLLGAPS